MILDELVRYLIPNEKGLWEHKMVTRNEIRKVKLYINYSISD